MIEKDISTVTFKDVKEFCGLKLRESLRIDYKRDFQNELERIVAGTLSLRKSALQISNL